MKMFDAGLLGWSNNHLFVISASKIKEFEASQNSQFTTTVTRASASPFQSMGNPPHIPSYIGTRRHMPRYDLSRMNSLYLVRPWLDTLLEHEGMQRGVFVEDEVMPPPSPNMDDEEICDEEIDGIPRRFLSLNHSLLPCAWEVCRGTRTGRSIVSPSQKRTSCSLVVYFRVVGQGTTVTPIEDTDSTSGCAQDYAARYGTSERVTPRVHVARPSHKGGRNTSTLLRCTRLSHDLHPST